MNLKKLKKYILKEIKLLKEQDNWGGPEWQEPYGFLYLYLNDPSVTAPPGVDITTGLPFNQGGTGLTSSGGVPCLPENNLTGIVQGLEQLIDYLIQIDNTETPFGAFYFESNAGNSGYLPMDGYDESVVPSVFCSSPNGNRLQQYKNITINIEPSYQTQNEFWWVNNWSPGQQTFDNVESWGELKELLDQTQPIMGAGGIDAVIAQGANTLEAIADVFQQWVLSSQSANAPEDFNITGIYPSSDVNFVCTTDSCSSYCRCTCAEPVNNIIELAECIGDIEIPPTTYMCHAGFGSANPYGNCMEDPSGNGPFESLEECENTGCGMYQPDGIDCTLLNTAFPINLDENGDGISDLYIPDAETWCISRCQGAYTNTQELVAQYPTILPNCDCCDPDDYPLRGCNIPGMENYNPEIISSPEYNDGSCYMLGCADPTAINYMVDANGNPPPFEVSLGIINVINDGSCYYNPGCTDPTAFNYDSEADYNDGSCQSWESYGPVCCEIYAENYGYNAEGQQLNINGNIDTYIMYYGPQGPNCDNSICEDNVSSSEPVPMKEPVKDPVKDPIKKLTGRKPERK